MFDLRGLEIHSEIQELKELGLNWEEIDGYICFFSIFPIDDDEEEYGIN